MWHGSRVTASKYWWSHLQKVITQPVVSYSFLFWEEGFKFLFRPLTGFNEMKARNAYTVGTGFGQCMFAVNSSLPWLARGFSRWLSIWSKQVSFGLLEVNVYIPKVFQPLKKLPVTPMFCFITWRDNFEAITQIWLVCHGVTLSKASTFKGKI